MNRWGCERFLEESRTQLRLDHVAAVVRVLDFIEAHGTAYMVLAQVRGETLERRLKRDKHLPQRKPSDCIAWLRDRGIPLRRLLAPAQSALVMTPHMLSSLREARGGHMM
jgi:hypothetical protein